jgi:hypothetical protein
LCPLASLKCPRPSPSAVLTVVVAWQAVMQGQFI